MSTNDYKFRLLEMAYLNDIPEYDEDEEMIECDCCGESFYKDDLQHYESGIFCNECVKFLLQNGAMTKEECEYSYALQ